MIAQIQVRRGTTAEWAAASPVVLAAGEPGWDSTLKRLKIGDGATEWVGLPWADNGTNPNILHNWDFRNPINQRGVSGTVSAVGYFIDRWFKYAAGDIVITSNGITCGSTIEQRIEGTGLAGQTATFSIMIGGVVYAKTMTFPSSTGSIASNIDMPMNVIFWHDTTSMRVRINAPPAALTYQAVKLELGTVSTLHLDPPMDWAVELPKCQWFYRRVDTANGAGVYFYGRSGFDSSGQFFLTIPGPQMRVNPTFVYDNVFRVVYAGSSYNATVTSVVSTMYGIVISGTCSESVLALRPIVAWANNIVELSADL